MLLVDDHETKVSKGHVLLEQRVGADHDASLTTGRIQESLPASLGPQGSGQEGEPGRHLSATKHARRREITQHGAHRAQVLLGQDICGCQQRSLPTRVDHLEHGSKRHDRLARADLALQESMHRMVQSQLGADLLADCQLPIGQLEGQLRIKCVEQSTLAAGPWIGCSGLHLESLAREHHLGDPGFVVFDAIFSLGLLGPTVGPVDPGVGRAQVEQSLALANLSRQWVREVVNQIQRNPDDILNLPSGQAAHLRIDRDQVWQLDDVAFGVGSIEPALGVGQLPFVTKPFEAPCEEPLSTRAHLLGSP